MVSEGFEEVCLALKDMYQRQDKSQVWFKHAIKETFCHEHLFMAGVSGTDITDHALCLRRILGNALLEYGKGRKENLSFTGKDGDHTVFLGGKWGSV